jgi:hypothetical protein
MVNIVKLSFLLKFIHKNMEVIKLLLLEFQLLPEIKVGIIKGLGLKLAAILIAV